MSTTTATPQKLSRLAKRVRLTCTFGARKDYDKLDDWQKSATGWTCVLHYQGRQYTFDFWQGPAISGEPDAAGTLSCLLSDANSAEGTFDDFCSEFGYDPDSRKAESIYKACQATNSAMKRLLGDDYETFVYAENDV